MNEFYVEEEPSPRIIQHSISKPEFQMADLNNVSFKKNHSSPFQEENNNLEIFKIRSILNNLLQMGFDISICHQIIQNMDVETKDSHLLMNEILDKYNFFNDSNPLNPDEQIQENVSFIQNYKSKPKNIIKSNVDNRYSPSREQSQMSDIKKNKTLKLCEICYETKPIDNFYSLRHCPHLFCQECLVKYLKQKINSSELLKIQCPANCPNELSDEEIKSILSKELPFFEKFKKLKELMLLNQDPNVRWCIRTGCNTVIRNKYNETKITCSKCAQEMCFKCRLAWHGSLSCVQALENELKVYSKKFPVKNCPKCKSKIEKNGGCNHMTCSRCKYQFCWLCCKKYSTNHYAFFNLFGCPNMQYSQMRSFRSSILQIIKLIVIFFFLLILGLTFFVFWGAIFIPIYLVILPVYLMVSFFKGIHKKFEAFIKLCVIFGIAMFGQALTREIQSIRNYVLAITMGIFGFLLSPLIFNSVVVILGIMYLIKKYMQKYRI